MIKLKKIKMVFLALNTICALGFFSAKAMEKFPTEQGKLKSVNNSLFKENILKYEYTLDVIDPQYKVEIRKDITPKQFYTGNRFIEDRKFYILDGKDMFCQKHNGCEFINVNFEKNPNFVFKYYKNLPAADDKYEIKKSIQSNEIFYFYDAKPVYRLEVQGNKIYYVDVMTNTRKYYSFKGKKQYYSTNENNIIVYDTLPLPESVSDNKTIFKYRSPEYYDLIKKSKFFKITTQEEFDKKYKIEKNDYEYESPEQMIMMKNFRINLNRFMKLEFGDRNTYEFDFVNICESKKLEDLSQENRRVFRKMHEIKENSEKAFSNFKRAYTGEITKKEENINQVGGEIVDPQFKVIKDREIEWYSYGGELKFYKILCSGRIYDIEGDEVERLPRADQNSQYDVVNRYGEIFYNVYGTGALEVTNEGNKTWFSVDGNKKFYSIKGLEGYVTLDRNEDLKLLGTPSLNEIDVTKIHNERQMNDNTFEYVPDPQYEIVKHNGKIVYFYEGIPRYIKVRDGYRDIESGKIYERLPIVNSEYFWDKEYEVVNRGGKTYYAVDGAPRFKVEEEDVFDLKKVNGENELLYTRLNYYNLNPDLTKKNRAFHSTKGERNYYFSSPNNNILNETSRKLVFKPQEDKSIDYNQKLILGPYTNPGMI